MNLGHGHVFPRDDGVRARCGGPGLCAECSRDLARKQQGLTDDAVTNAMVKAAGHVILIIECIRCGRDYPVGDKLPDDVRLTCACGTVSWRRIP